MGLFDLWFLDWGTSSEANACPTEMSSVRYDDIDPDTTEIALELARPLD
jgi:hypothetical protein